MIMRPISKQFGFWLLLSVGFLNTLAGNHEIAAAFVISSLFYDAIKKD